MSVFARLSGLVLRGACTALALGLVLVWSGAARAQFDEPESGKGAGFGEATTKRYRAGVVVEAVGGACKGLMATIAVPTDWPEQEVRIDGEELSPAVRPIKYRMLGNTVKQMLVEIPVLAAGQRAQAIVTFEVRRRTILAPEDTSIFVEPKKVPKEFRVFTGPSPYIESRHPQIRALAKEAIAGKEGAWAKVEALYDVTREKIQFKDMPLKGALQALRDGDGDCEELSSLFIALCRANDIPARTVWVPGHCYAEFYLEDDAGKGHWFPCQPAGTRAFGEIPEMRPVLQKGDNFKVPEKKDAQRYVAEFLKGVPVAGGGGKPKVQWVREYVD